MQKKLANSRLAEYVQSVLASQAASKKLKYGFELKQKLVHPALLKDVNQYYESLVWGLQDDADHAIIASDEKRILKNVLSSRALQVLEVGPGSGRVTFEISRLADHCSVIEREAAVMKKLKTHFAQMKKQFQLSIVGDFSRPLDRRLVKAFDRVILIENMLGMNPVIQDRIRILKNAARVLKPNGMALFGFRMRADIKRSHQFQIMPYSYEVKGQKNQWFGNAINWSVPGFLSELKQSKAPLKCVKIIAGQSRPAGGRMYFAVLNRT